MGLVNVSVDTSELGRCIEQYSDRIKAVPMAIIGEGLVTAIDDLIQSEGEGRWPGFSPVTLRLHPERRGGKLLQDTGQLANVQITEETPNSVTVASPAGYAGFHVTGTYQDNIYNAYAPHEMPARNFLGINIGNVLDEAAESITDEIVN